MGIYPKDHEVAIFVVYNPFLRRRVILGRWFYPQRHKDVSAMLGHVEKCFFRFIPKGRAKESQGSRWKVLEANAMDHRVVDRGDLDTIFIHAMACHRFGLATVRAYFDVIGAWPSSTDLKAREPKVGNDFEAWLRTKGVKMRLIRSIIEGYMRKGGLSAVRSYAERRIRPRHYFVVNPDGSFVALRNLEPGSPSLDEPERPPSS